MYYSRIQLLQLRYKHARSCAWFSDCIVQLRQSNILNNGITKTHRGVRAGVRVKARQHNGNLRIVHYEQFSVQSVLGQGQYQYSVAKQSTVSDRKANIFNLKPIAKELQHSRSVKIKFGLINTQSVRNKSAALLDYVFDQNIDVCCLTETWLSTNDDLVRFSLKPPGYDFQDSPRKNGRTGGGIGLLHRENIQASMVAQGEVDSFEFSEWLLQFQRKPLRLCVVYRPPYSAKHKVTKAVFHRQFADYLESVVTKPNPLLVVGDVNIHLNRLIDNDTRQFNDVLSSMALEQVVRDPTHVSGNILDVVIKRKDDDIVLSTTVHDELFSDHRVVSASICFPLPPLTVVDRLSRKIKQIDQESFQSDLRQVVNQAEGIDDLRALAKLYNTEFRAILDKHAPVVKKRVVIRPKLPWYNEDLQICKRRKLVRTIVWIWY
ncbi:hypothetical protein HOLleu_31177 [Holothuria leucospilota]|uniref:Endonuclease/exonuclease/phosphatase domain-containing protein n=1 Tax=Holothuria leucospilota TaxID=206669 RepID=A0A9Q1H0J9_HOLLE|nr:hypothetical protein HOLleu_31177 [Holothuria leucospilota]